MSGDDETRDKEHLKQSLEAIIEGVAGEHSSSLTASGSSKDSGEHLDSPKSARLISTLCMNVKFFHYRKISKPMAEWQAARLAQHGLAGHDMARHGTAQHSSAQHRTVRKYGQT